MCSSTESRPGDYIEGTGKADEIHSGAGNDTALADSNDILGADLESVLLA